MTEELVSSRGYNQQIVCNDFYVSLYHDEGQARMLLMIMVEVTRLQEHKQKK
jgi:hypothetical protein